MSFHGNNLLHSEKKEARFEIPHGGNYNDVGGRNNLRPRIFTALAWFFIFLIVVGLSAKILCLSWKVEEQKRQTQINGKLLRQLLKSHANPHETVRNSAQGSDQGENVDLLEAYVRTQNNNSADIDHDVVDGGRTKRSAGSSRRKRHKKYPLLCHLEGKGGPNIISEIGVPRQRPRSTRECILWKKSDLERPSYCFMETVNEAGGYGIQYIKIVVPGLYYVYSQLTYEADLWTDTGHSVVLTNEGGRVAKTLLTAMAPWKKVAPENYSSIVAEESRYTGGVFHLQAGDLLAVYPLKPMDTFVMTESKSFFGVMQLAKFHG